MANLLEGSVDLDFEILYLITGSGLNKDIQDGHTNHDNKYVDNYEKNLSNGKPI